MSTLNRVILGEPPYDSDFAYALAVDGSNNVIVMGSSAVDFYPNLGGSEGPVVATVAQTAYLQAPCCARMEFGESAL
jgi:hypothetical protein